MSAHLLGEDTLALIRREFFGHRKIIDAHNAGMSITDNQALNGYLMAVEAMSKLLEHVEALDDGDASDLAYAGLAFVYQRERWHETQESRVAFNDMQAAYDHLKQAVDEYNAAVYSGEGT